MPFKHSNIIKDLKRFIRVLKKYRFDNIMDIYQLELMVGVSKPSCNYELDDMTFRISTSGMKCDPHVHKIAVAIKINYELEPDLSSIVDIFQTYSFELFIRGYKKKETEDFSHFFCWHLDREEHTNGKYVHPLYHFHAGGNRLREKEKGELFMISSPRIPHPPMDIILAIHFVIQNFINSSEFESKDMILKDSEYINIVERSQERVLDPYFKVFSSKEHKSYTPQNLFPLYL